MMDHGSTTLDFKSPSIVITIIISAAIVLSSWQLAASIEAYGRSVERASQMTRPASVHIPSTISIRLESGNSPIRISNQ